MQYLRIIGYYSAITLLALPLFTPSLFANSTIIKNALTTAKNLAGPSSHFLDMFDDEEFMNDLISNDFLDTVNTNQNLLRDIQPKDIIEFLLAADAISILQEDLFLHTNPLNKRSLLDYPIFEIHQCCPEHTWIIGSHIFYNQTTRSNFTQDCTNLCSYLALRQPSLLEKLQSAIDKVKDLLDPDLDIDKMTKLFENFTIQERRTGFMFHLLGQWKRTEFRLLLPFYYLEQNYFATNEEQKALEAEFGKLDPKKQQELEGNHLIGDKIGFGDTRLEFDVEIWKGDLYSLRVGVQATIPTAFAVKKGIRGSTYEKKCDLPTFNFDQLFELAEEITDENQQKAFDQIETFLLGALDRLSANLLDTKLGNGGHVGIGGFIRTRASLSAFFKRGWLDNFCYEGRISLEHFFIRRERRSFILKNDPSAFATRDFENEDQAEENLTFLEQEFINRSHLVGAEVVIQPGILLRWASKLCYKGKRWEFTLGNDFWLKSKDRFDALSPIAEKFCTKLAIHKAKPFFAYQSKLFGGIAFKFERPKRDWCISLNADGTYWGSGIGNDFTVSINIEALF